MALLGCHQPDPPGPFRDRRDEYLDLRIFTARQRIVLDVSGGGESGRLSPAPMLPGQSGPMSAAVLMGLAKAFDDGLYAAVEVWLQRRAKRDLLNALRHCHPLLAAAAELGGGTAVAPADAEATSIRDAFLNDELRSKPVGFYTWNTPLAQVFRQDRLLQSGLFPRGDARVASLVQTLHASRGARDAYELTLRIAERLTNPLVLPDLRPWLASLDTGVPYVPPECLAWLPASTSHESRLIEQLYGTTEIPDGCDLMAELIARVRSGDLTLEPRSTSGWYDHQTWAHAALLTCPLNVESTHLSTRSGYRDLLVERFKASLTSTRETHVKQLPTVLTGAGGGGGRPVRRQVRIQPDLTIEPLVTFYERRAASYRYVREILEEELGTSALHDMRRMTPDGSIDRPLGEALDRMAAIFDGAGSRARFELGMAPKTDDGAFQRFTEGLATEPDVVRDTRVMVPVFFDVGRGRLKVWCLLGWTTVWASAGFVVVPDVRIPSGADVDLTYDEQAFRLPMPVVCEVYTSRLLNRTEFRRLCDRHKTGDAIVAAIRNL